MMTKNRRSLRLPGHDYSWPGVYFVTICTFERRCLFGEIYQGEMRLNALGRLIEKVWLTTSQIREQIILDAFIVMPNHLHGILFIQGNYNALGGMGPTDLTPALGQGRTEYFGRANGSPLRRPYCKSGSLGAIIGQFKSQATKKARAHGLITGLPLWQRNYYEHVIRDEDDLNRIREYILGNPLRWSEDRENPECLPKGNLPAFGTT